MGDQAAHAHRVHRDAVDVRATSVIGLELGGVRRGADPCALAGRGNATCGVGCRARGRIDLVGVMQLDDLDRLEVRCGNLGEVHHQHGTDAEVGSDEHAHGGVGRAPGAHLRESSLVEAGGSHDAVNARTDAVLEGRHDCVRRGEVDNDIGAIELARTIALIDGDGQCAVRRGIDSIDHGTTHAPTGTDDSYANSHGII